MESMFATFHLAQHQGSGPILATTLNPIPPAHDPTLLRRFHKDSNVFSIYNDIQHYIKISQSRLTKSEGNAWIEIYVAFWKAIGEILRAETGHHRDDWAIKVYEAWKEVTNLLIRGFSHAGFGAWLMPCLYTAGKYLRVFAIKADEEKATKVGNGTMKMEEDILADDITVNFEKNEMLEDAARVLNKVFTLCISDRYVDIACQFKWFDSMLNSFLLEHRLRSPENGASITPRIFSSKPTSRYPQSISLVLRPSTAYDPQLNSISLSKNCLRALQAAKSDMPPMEAFPKSHIVTFRYYVGVIQFLDEEYSRVPISSSTPASHTTNLSLTFSRQKKTSPQHGTCVTKPPIETKSQSPLSPFPFPLPLFSPFSLPTSPKFPSTNILRLNRLLLTYLIPTHLHTTLTLPTPSLLSSLPHLSPLFTPLLSSIKLGSLRTFTSALSLHESTFVKRRVYLSLERARDICLRNLLRKVWLLQGGKENTRVKVRILAAGVRCSMYGDGERGEVEDEEVECLVAGLIYKVRSFFFRSLILRQPNPYTFPPHPFPYTTPPV